MGTTTRPYVTLPDNIQAVLFDLDATLIDTKTAHLGQAVAFVQAHLPVHDVSSRWDGEEAAVGHTTGSHAHAHVLPVVLERRVGRVIAACYLRLRRHVALDAEARRVLETLRQAGLPIGVVTNGSLRKRQTIHLLGLDRMTSCIFISAECGHRKPDAAIFQAAASCVGAHPARVLFVGDHLRDDIWGAHGVGMATAWLRRGHRWPLPRSAPGADVTIEALNDVIAALGLAPLSGPSRTPGDQRAPASGRPARQQATRESDEGAARRGR